MFLSSGSPPLRGPLLACGGVVCCCVFVLLCCVVPPLEKTNPNFCFGHLVWPNGNDRLWPIQFLANPILCCVVVGVVGVGLLLWLLCVVVGVCCGWLLLVIVGLDDPPLDPSAEPPSADCLARADSFRETSESQRH